MESPEELYDILADIKYDSSAYGGKYTFFGDDDIELNMPEDFRKAYLPEKGLSEAEEEGEIMFISLKNAPILFFDPDKGRLSSPDPSKKALVHYRMCESGVLELFMGTMVSPFFAPGSYTELLEFLRFQKNYAKRRFGPGKGTEVLIADIIESLYIPFPELSVRDSREGSLDWAKLDKIHDLVQARIASGMPWVGDEYPNLSPTEWDRFDELSEGDYPSTADFSMTLPGTFQYGENGEISLPFLVKLKDSYFAPWFDESLNRYMYHFIMMGTETFLATGNSSQINENAMKVPAFHCQILEVLNARFLQQTLIQAGEKISHSARFCAFEGDEMGIRCLADRIDDLQNRRRMIECAISATGAKTKVMERYVKPLPFFIEHTLIAHDQSAEAERFDTVFQAFNDLLYYSCILALDELAEVAPSLMEFTGLQEQAGIHLRHPQDWLSWRFIIESMVPVSPSMPVFGGWVRRLADHGREINEMMGLAQKINSASAVEVRSLKKKVAELALRILGWWETSLRDFGMGMRMGIVKGRPTVRQIVLKDEIDVSFDYYDFMTATHPLPTSHCSYQEKGGLFPDKAGTFALRGGHFHELKHLMRLEWLEETQNFETFCYESENQDHTLRFSSLSTERILTIRDDGLLKKLVVP